MVANKSGIINCFEDMDFKKVDGYNYVFYNEKKDKIIRFDRKNLEVKCTTISTPRKVKGLNIKETRLALELLKLFRDED